MALIKLLMSRAAPHPRCVLCENVGATELHVSFFLPQRVWTHSNSSWQEVSKAAFFLSKHFTKRYEASTQQGGGHLPRVAERKKNPSLLFLLPIFTSRVIYNSAGNRVEPELFSFSSLDSLGAV